jgi:hypothetical protein
MHVSQYFWGFPYVIITPSALHNKQLPAFIRNKELRANGYSIVQHLH